MKAKCFECGKELKIGKSMEELVELKLPLFCCTECSIKFPDNGTDKFEQRLKDWRGRF